MRFIKSDVTMRILIATTLVISGVVHAYLYVHGYRHVPAIGNAFLTRASAFVALAILILAGGPGWLRVAAAIGAAGALVAFGLSRTTWLFGFVEVGWESPSGVIAVIAEVATVMLCGMWAFSRKSTRRPVSA
jgi:hypothetical protein